MPKPKTIEIGKSEIPILYEDRSVLAIDKPAGWLLVPSHWDRTGRNLQLAIDSSIRGGDFWARSRNLKFLKFVHRLDAETTGVLLFSRSAGAVSQISRLFEGRQMEKRYLAVVTGTVPGEEWTSDQPIGTDPAAPGRMMINGKEARNAVTNFRVLGRKAERTLILAEPVTGRTHQIRLHLAHSGCPVLGDRIYSRSAEMKGEFPLGLRAIALSYSDPFSRRSVSIEAPTEEFCRAFGFPSES